METESIEVRSRPPIPKYVTKLLGLAASVMVVANRHFPERSYERDVLEEANSTFLTLYNFKADLWHTLNRTEEMRRLTLKEQSGILSMSNRLKDVAATFEAGSEDRAFYARAGDLMDLWYSLCKEFDDLRRVSERLRYAVEVTPADLVELSDAGRKA